MKKIFNCIKHMWDDCECVESCRRGKGELCLHGNVYNSGSFMVCDDCGETLM